MKQIPRRSAIGGMAGLLLASLGHRALAQNAEIGRTTTSPEGLIRTLLQEVKLPDGGQFKMILDTFPAGIVIPSHHHPSFGLNYVLEGHAESQYEGEKPIRVGPGDTFIDYPDRQHLLFRNLSAELPVKVLIVFMVEEGQPFFIRP